MYYNKTRIEKLRASYTGTRIELLSMEGESDMPNGLRGTVDFVDDIGHYEQLIIMETKWYKFRRIQKFYD